MGSSFIFVPLYNYDPSQKKWNKFAWIGPRESLKPEPRKFLNKKSKLEVLARQKNRCRFCESKITLEPYCNADADHIIPINYGGKTNLDNIQLLCVGCHRHKTSLENTNDFRVVYLDKEKIKKGETFVVYSSNPELERPMDMRNPLEIPNQSEINEQSFVLNYSKKRKGVYTDQNACLEDHDEYRESTFNIFDKFRYKG